MVFEKIIRILLLDNLVEYNIDLGEEILELEGTMRDDRVFEYYYLLHHLFISFVHSSINCLSLCKV